MYLKSIEIIGFKSFANKTRIELKPGTTAIVGPNGCGKSNISDAVRWVLGEQRARVLRGTKMEDIIFNGTDKTKPMGMAEVSLTLAECSNLLDTEYDEVCITRRVFRSGESGYFLNRKVCRLKDIQRLFMDTGIGTDSYSILEQGKIDQILSAKPEDRRSVFEEASGITKFKSDKKEALRKLEHTESNLLRLDDIIREVKRQIISLQRQAGKAKRYRNLSKEIRSLDIYISNQQINENKKINTDLDKKIELINCSINNYQDQINSTEEKAHNARDSLSIREKTINELIENASSTRSELNQANQLIVVNKDRIKEFSLLAERDNQESNTAQLKLDSYKKELADVEKSYIYDRENIKKAEEELNKALSNQKAYEEENIKVRNYLSKMRTQAIEIDSLVSKLQNDLNLIEAQNQDDLLKRERLSTEQEQLKRTMEYFNANEQEMLLLVEKLNNEINQEVKNIEIIKNDNDALKREFRTRQITDIFDDFKNNLITVNEAINQIDTLYKSKGNKQDQIDTLEVELENKKRSNAIQQGELQAIKREKESIRKKINVVSSELELLLSKSGNKSNNKQDIINHINKYKEDQNTLRSNIKTYNDKFTVIEEKRSQVFEYTSEKRIEYLEYKQKQEQFNIKKQPLEARISELEVLIKERAIGINNYTTRSNELQKQSKETELKIEPLNELVRSNDSKLEEEQKNREINLQTLAEAENTLRDQRKELDGLLKEKSEIDIKRTKILMQNDSLISRITNTYNITESEIDLEDKPEWNDDQIPQKEEIETRIAEIQAKLDLMGPVNLVAIDEHAEHEERYTFLMKEQSDLTNAKQQLLEMIKKINKTTTSLFIDTFNNVNDEFQKMFNNLFGGGSAKLVLTDEEDILEAGVEIIARPPGKKLQSISLLSGGERTMTAVALLFSLFKVKPSPFCVLDELDAALDDANINRFINVLKDFISKSQFVIITHNRQTIAEADVIYGVTMENKGVSKIVSMQFSDYKVKEKQLASS